MPTADMLEEIKRDRERACSDAAARERRENSNAEYRAKKALHDVYRIIKGRPYIDLKDGDVGRLGQAMILLHEVKGRLGYQAEKDVRQALGFICLQFSHRLDKSFNGDRPAAETPSPEGLRTEPAPPKSDDDDL
ncbi:hypothetical protein GWK16_16330 [Roseomonas sp. JC162]|uniref:Uncharacterized protein n=1 Tax=Neoroseomonas marina TaxID=1232220 RepID=A0A848EDZ6_9PROT|nr:hypothetical protein [Neoroseomonas marina]NMJ42814.1 hypothetical protein [Neoroseomonas marina]